MTKKTPSKPSPKPSRALGEGTTVADAQHNSAVTAAAQCVRINSDLETRYRSYFGGWATEVNAGKRNNKNWPMPPNAWISSLHPDGYTYEIQGLQPVCAVPPIPEDHSEPIVIEKSLLNVINVPPGDTKSTGNMADGAYLIGLGASPLEVGSPGSIWMKMEAGTPFGVAHWYQRIG